MSKHRPPPLPALPAGAFTSGLTSASTFQEVELARIRIRGEINRRRAYAELLALEAELAKTPALPAADRNL